jgi:hypothetical protein
VFAIVISHIWEHAAGKGESETGGKTSTGHLQNGPTFRRITSSVDQVGPMPTVWVKSRPTFALQGALGADLGRILPPRRAPDNVLACKRQVRSALR